MNRYQNIKQIRSNITSGKVIYQTVRYPEIPLSSDDIYVYTTQGDRFDILANQYYKDSSLWWVISIANTDKLNQMVQLNTNIQNVTQQIIQLKQLTVTQQPAQPAIPAQPAQQGLTENRKTNKIIKVKDIQ